MAVERSFLVKLVGDAKQLISEFQKTEKAAEGVFGKGGLGGKLMGLVPSFKTISIAGTAAFGAVTAAAGLAVRAAAQDAESQARLAQALRTTFGESQNLVAATEEFVKSMSQAAAVADDQLRPSMTTLIRATGDMRQSQELLKLALDISAGSGRDLESVTIALARASQGQMTALTRLGVPLDQNAVKTKNFEAVTRQLADTFEGAAAASADSAQGRFRAFGIAVDELQEQFGELLLPALTEVVDYLTKTVIPAVSLAIEQFRSKGVRAALAYFVAAFGEAGIAILNNLEQVALGIYKFMEGVVSALRPLFAAIDAVRAFLAFSKPIETIEGAIARRTEEVAGAFDSFRDSVAQASKRLEIISSGPMDVVERRLAQTNRLAKGAAGGLDEFGDGADRAGGKAGGAADKVKKFKDRLQDYTQAVKQAKSASDAFGRSQERVGDARSSLAQADVELARAQDELARAQRAGSPDEIAAAQRRLAAAERGLERAKFGQEEAIIAVRDAEKRLAEIRLDPESTPDAIRLAEIDLAEAKFRVADAEDNQIEVANGLAEARRQLRIATDGLREGDAELLPFQSAVEELMRRQEDAARSYQDALEDQTEALREYREALDAVAQAGGLVPKFSSTNPVTGLIPLPPSEPQGFSFDERIARMAGVGSLNITVDSSIVNPQQVGQEIADYLREWSLGGGNLTGFIGNR